MPQLQTVLHTKMHVLCSDFELISLSKHCSDDVMMTQLVCVAVVAGEAVVGDTATRRL